MSLDVAGILDMTFSLLGAFALALPIAWHRERSTRSIGLRTFPLVAVSSCGYALVGLEVAGTDPNALSRLLQGLMTGIGFVGGGAIVKQSQSDEVSGTATAAAIWATGAVGAAMAFDRFALAVAISGLAFLTFLLLTPVGNVLREGDEESEKS